MRLQTLTFLFGLLLYHQVNGQLILTEEENRAWTSKLRDEKDFSFQLEIIRARILVDTNVYVRNIGDRQILKKGKNENKKDALCRPVLLVDGHYIEITNDTDRKAIEKLAKELTTKNIKQIEVIAADKARALFGHNGSCGAILITAKNKKAKRTLLRYKV